MTNPKPRHLLLPFAIAAVALAGCADTQKAVIPAGTTLVATLNGPLSTAANRAGDPFLATIRQPLQVNEKTVIAAGATVRGEVAEIDAGSTAGATPRITLICNEIALATGEVLTITTSPLVIEGTATPPAVASDLAAAPGLEAGAEPAPSAATEPTDTALPEASATLPAGDLTLSPGHELQIEIVLPAEVAVAAS